MNIDKDYLPLHLISRDLLNETQGLLKRIEECSKSIEQKKKEGELDEIEELAQEITELSNQFYQLIPDKNHKETTVPPLNNTWIIKQKQRMIHDLMYFEIVIRVLCGA